MKKKTWWLVIACVVIIVGIIGAAWWPVTLAGQAGVTISPDNLSLMAGQSQTVKVEVQSQVAINALDISLRYPNDQYVITAATTKQTRFDLVLFPPAVKNEAGTVRLIQATSTPFTGRNGLVATVTVKALKATTAQLSINEVKLVANDGKGTNVYQADKVVPRWKVWFGGDKN